MNSFIITKAPGLLAFCTYDNQHTSAVVLVLSTMCRNYRGSLEIIAPTVLLQVRHEHIQTQVDHSLDDADMGDICGSLEMT